MTQPDLTAILPHRAPEAQDERILLYALRRMAIHGLHDARGSAAMVGQFGLQSRRLTILLRAAIFDVARTAAGSVQLANCCAPRMTEHEHAMLRAATDIDGQDALRTSGIHRPDTPPLPTFAALSEALGEHRLRSMVVRR